MKTIEEIIKYLKSPYYQTSSELKVIYNEDLPNGKAGLNRNIYVESENGNKFIIEWWKNILYIHYEKSIIPCDDIEISSNWPNHSKLNIVGKHKKETIFILPIRDY